MAAVLNVTFHGLRDVLPVAHGTAEHLRVGEVFAAAEGSALVDDR